MAKAKLSGKRLEHYQKRATKLLISSYRRRHSMLVDADELLSMIAEIMELRAIADPQALTAAYMLGAADKGDRS